MAQYRDEEHKENSKNGLANLEKGRYFFDRKEYDRSVAYLHKALKFPLDSISRERVYHYLTESYYASGKNSQAMKYAQETIYNPSPNLDPAAHYRKGTILFKQGKYTDAAAEFESVIEKYPNSIYAEKSRAFKKESLNILKEDNKYNPDNSSDKEDPIIDETEDE